MPLTSMVFPAVHLASQSKRFGRSSPQPRIKISARLRHKVLPKSKLASGLATGHCSLVTAPVCPLAISPALRLESLVLHFPDTSEGALLDSTLYPPGDGSHLER